MAITQAPVLNLLTEHQLLLTFNLSSSSIALDYFHRNSERNISIEIKYCSVQLFNCFLVQLFNYFFK